MANVTQAGFYISSTRFEVTNATGTVQISVRSRHYAVSACITSLRGRSGVDPLEIDGEGDAGSENGGVRLGVRLSEHDIGQGGDGHAVPTSEQARAVESLIHALTLGRVEARGNLAHAVHPRVVGEVLVQGKIEQLGCSTDVDNGRLRDFY